MSEPFLSFCIPTYNMGGELAEALESIIIQASSEVEIVVCDNASTDSTAEIVEQFRSRGLALRYFRWPENQGFMANLMKTTQLSSGKWCWILGADDVVIEGAVERVISFLRTNPDLAGLSLQLLSYDFT